MYSIQWEVTRLRKHGVRLRSSELEPCVRGVLEITDFPGGGSFKRPVKVARLYMPEQGYTTRCESLIPIFDPQLLRLEDGVLVITGTELHGADGRTAEHVQVWRCVPVVG